MIDRMGRKRALLGLTAMAVGALTILAPATAFAQVPDLGTTVDTVGSTTGTVTEPIKDTVDSTTGTVDQTTDDLETVVDDTGSTVDKVAPGEPVGSTTKIVEDTTKTTTESVSGTVGTVDESTGGIGGGLLNPDLTVKSPKNSKATKKELAAQEKTATELRAALLAAARAEEAAAKAKDSALANLERSRRVQGEPVSLIAPPARESFLTQLADAAVEATKKLAFPLGLALMVGAFLMVQGRIDRKDAKLALAPIDSEQDLLSFQ